MNNEIQKYKKGYLCIIESNDENCDRNEVVELDKDTEFYVGEIVIWENIKYKVTSIGYNLTVREVE